MFCLVCEWPSQFCPGVRQLSDVFLIDPCGCRRLRWMLVLFRVSSCPWCWLCGRGLRDPGLQAAWAPSPCRVLRASVRPRPGAGPTHRLGIGFDVCTHRTEKFGGGGCPCCRLPLLRCPFGHLLNNTATLPQPPLHSPLTFSLQTPPPPARPF